MSVCPNCGDRCCNWIDCYYEDWKVDLIPTEYRWECPKCKTTNIVVNEFYPSSIDCYKCGEEVKLILKNMKREI
jgi:hypothetical protein